MLQSNSQLTTEPEGEEQIAGCPADLYSSLLSLSDYIANLCTIKNICSEEHIISLWVNLKNLRRTRN